MLRRLFDFSHVDHSTFEEEVAERVVRLAAGYGALAIAMFGIHFWLNEPREFVAANLVVSLLLAAVALFRPISPYFSMFLAGSMALLLIGYQLFMLGGLSHSPAVWLLVPGMAVLLIGMRRLSLQLSAVSALIVFGILVGDRLGWVRTRVSFPDPEGQTAASLIGSQALVLLLGFLILRARDRLLVENRERTRQLAEALDHARLARTEAEQARNEALEAVRHKEQFFANLTHEIRTPLGGVVGVAAMLDRGGPRPDQRAYVDALNASARELSEVVESMLDHARLSVGQFSSELSPFSLRELVDSLRVLFADRATQQGLDLDCALAPDSPHWVLSDRIWLRRILSNLIGNAVKFTQAGSVGLRLSIQDAPPDGPSAPDGDAVAAGAVGSSVPTEGPPADAVRWLIAEVRDTGIGIAADKIDSIFQPFVQADASITRRFGGTGLGLAISRRLAELLGGSLRVQSTPGEGSQFTLALPVRIVPSPIPLDEPALPQDQAPPMSPPPAPPTGHAPLHVLLVEDNPVNLMLGEEMLRSLGCEVVVAEHGGLAISLATEQRFELILMDLQMPEVDGISATRAIRAHERSHALPAAPIYALTGNSVNDYGDACRDAGMQGFLTKPIGLDALQSLLASVAASGAQHDG